MTTPPADTPESQPDEIDIPSINRKMAKGATWMIALQMALRGIGLVSTIILARLLVPEDFGLVALATMLLGALEIMAAFSFDMALIRDQKADRSHYDTVWTMSIMRGFGFAVALAAFAQTAATFFEEPRLANVLYCLAAASVIQCFSNVGVVDFRKELQFGREFRFRVWGKLCAFVITVSLAFVWGNYWALVAGILGSRVFQLVQSYVVHHYRPRFSLARWREIFHFSKWMVINNILLFVSNRADTFIIGKLIGVDKVGLYSVAYEVSNLPTTELVWPIQRAIFPGYAKLNGNIGHLRRAYLDVLALALLVAAPMGIGIGLVAEPLVLVFLGDKWVEAIPVIEVLALFGVIRVGFANTGSIFMAAGQLSVLTWLAILGIALRLPLLLWGTLEAGLLGAAWGLAAATFATLIINFVVIVRFLALSWTALFGRIWRVLLAVALMAAAVKATAYALSTSMPGTPLAAQLMLLVVVGAMTYLLVLFAAWRLCGSPDGAEQQILNVLASRLNRRARPVPTGE
jgi:lipopolysaccharide exporter